jgi:threonine dehydrogenase-like Zn-dependent dehydrogenase
MRSAVVVGPRRAQPVDVESPRPSRGEVLVAVEGCGACGSTVPAWEGRPWFEYPLAPGSLGHEGWGHVEEIGEAVGGVAVGDRVAFLHEHAFAERVAVAGDRVVVLPRELDGIPFPGEALGCAWNAVRRSDLHAGQTVVVVGIGFLGAVMTAFASRAGCRVVAVSRRPFALDVAHAMGAAETVVLGHAGATGDDALARVLDRTGGLCDRVVEAVGVQSTLDLASSLCAEGGRLVIAGYHQDGRRSVDLQLWGWRGIDVVNAHERDPGVVLDGIRHAADAVATGMIDTGPLYTHRAPLEDIGAALDALVARPGGFLKALVVP